MELPAASSENIIMHDVVVYLGSLPRIADRNRKVEVLRAFARGAQAQGARVLLQEQRQIVPARLAVILGWVGAKIRGPHIQLRKDLITYQAANGHKLMSIDSSCFKFADPNSIWLRYSIDGVYYNSSNYANQGSNDRRWLEIQQSLGLGLGPWRSNGDHVLVCLQRDGGWSMKGTDLVQWAQDTVKTIRLYTQRPIRIRSHPKFPVSPTVFQGIPGLSFSQGTTLQQDLQGAWASVFFNSSACVASVLAGVPVFASDDDCVAWSVANHDIANIESPVMPPREQWLYDLAAAHWTDDHSARGDIYNKFSQYLKMANR